MTVVLEIQRCKLRKSLLDSDGRDINHQSATQNIFNKYGDKQQELKVSSHGQRTYVKKLANPSLCFVLVHAVLPSSPSSPSPPLHPFYRLSRLLFWAAEGGGQA